MWVEVHCQRGHCELFDDGVFGFELVVVVAVGDSQLVARVGYGIVLEEDDVDDLVDVAVVERVARFGCV